jgi:cytochrome c peroxidase
MATAARTFLSRTLQTTTRQAYSKPILRRNLTTFNTTSTRSTVQPLRRTQHARFQSTQATPKKGGSGLLLGALAVAAAGGGYAYYSGALDAYLVDPEEAKKQKTGKGWIPSFKDYQDVYNDIAAILEDDSDYDDGSYAPVSSPRTCRYTAIWNR